MTTLRHTELRPTHGEPSFRSAANVSAVKLLLAIFGHMVLALAMWRSSSVAVAHLATTLIVGAWLVVRAKTSATAALVVAYIAGAEVLWRMTSGAVFWEVAKFAVIAITLIALFKWRPKVWGLPVLYFAVLLPSSVLTVSNFGLLGSRGALSFNLSGPLSLAIAAVLFKSMRLTLAELRGALLVTILPIVGIATLAVRSIRATEQIVFSNESNFVTSGGFGPNQVSAMLSLGALICLLLILLRPGRRPAFIFGLLGVWMASQSVLTFSRGGLLNLVVALAVGILYLLGTRGAPKAVLGAFLLLIVFTAFAIWPHLNAFTGGALESRFSDFGSTERGSLANNDVQTFKSHPFLGVGPGNSNAFHLEKIGITAAAHAEYSRLLAEHGTFGVVALVLLAMMAFSSVRRAPPGVHRAIAITLMLWSLADMSHAAMRIAAISVFFALPASLGNFSAKEVHALDR